MYSQSLPLLQTEGHALEQLGIPQKVNSRDLNNIIPLSQQRGGQSYVKYSQIQSTDNVIRKLVCLSSPVQARCCWNPTSGGWGQPGGDGFLD